MELFYSGWVSKLILDASIRAQINQLSFNELVSKIRPEG